jgi:hypothetical protein
MTVEADNPYPTRDFDHYEDRGETEGIGHTTTPALR